MKLREEEFYEQYHQHGGTTIIPTEIFNELYDDATEEIERLEQGYCELKEKCNKSECDCTHEEYNNMCEANIKMDLEIERLNSIIKEVRDLVYKIQQDNKRLEPIISTDELDDILEILDKEKE